MPQPGNSSLALHGYSNGSPVGLPISELNLQKGALVIDQTTPAIWQKTSTSDNSGFNQLTAGVTSNSPTVGIGYSTGAGGAVTQATNRTTGVTLNKISGTITTNNASLAAETAAVFTVTNSTVAVGDVPILAIQSGSNGGNTTVTVTTVAAGSFQITVANQNASGGTAETGAILINYAIIKAVSA